MTEAAQERIVLEGSSVAHLSVASFAVIHLLEGPDGMPYQGACLTVVMNGKEQDLDICLGETFEVADQVWRLDEATMLGDGRTSVTISRVA